MSGLQAAQGLSAFGGAWAFALHGAEQDAEKLKSQFIKSAGVIGIVCAFIFIGLFLGMFFKIIETNKKVKRKESDLLEGDINYNLLSPDVQDHWDAMYILIIVSAICGFITLIITTLLNEGFLSPAPGTTNFITWLVVIFGLGGTAVTLGFIIGMLLVKWPYTNTPDEVHKKKPIWVTEDEKLYKIIPTDKIYGITMSIFFLLPIFTILGTEWDENEAHQSVQSTMSGAQ